jgi:hypothetical protein
MASVWQPFEEPLPQAFFRTSLIAVAAAIMRFVAEHFKRPEGVATGCCRYFPNFL